MLVVGHDHGNMAVGSIVLSVVPIGKLIGTRKSEFAGTPHAAPKPSKPRKNSSTGAVVNFSIFNTAEFRSQIRPIQDTLQP